MILLALETSTPLGSLVIQSLQDSRITTLFEKSWGIPLKMKQAKGHRSPSHSELATVYLQEGLNHTNLKPNDIELFCVSSGPGSFTGIRVGINTIKTLSYSAEKPIFTLNSLELMAYPHLDFETPVTAMLNANKNQIYIASYLKSHDPNKVFDILLEPQSLTVREIEKVVPRPGLIIGSGFDFYRDQFSNGFIDLIHKTDTTITPMASTFSQVLQDHHPKINFISWMQLTPIHIRASEAEEKLWRGALKPFLKIEYK